MTPTANRREGAHEAGVVLLLVLVVLIAIGGSSASFLWFMSQEQTRAGARYRSAAALAVAEAGVHRALSALETVSSNAGSSFHRLPPDGFSERIGAGLVHERFTVSFEADEDGAILITSAGEAGGVARRLQARVYLASTALLAALYGRGIVRLEQPPATTVVLPYGSGVGDRPWGYVAAGEGIWFATAEVSLNKPAEVLDVGPGPIDPPFSDPTAALRRLGPVPLVLGGDAEITLGERMQRVDVQQLRLWGVSVDGAVVRAGVLPPLPGVDRAFYQKQAAANDLNAGLNHAAGRYLWDTPLARKSDSLYTRAEFERLQAYFRTQATTSRFNGVVYVRGPVTLSWRERLEIVDGALIAEDTVRVGESASLQITHSPTTRMLPGLIVLDGGGLVVTLEARLRVHGLVYAAGVIEVSDGAHADIVGAVLGGEQGLSFHNFAASVVIRYDPAVLGTPGLRGPTGAHTVAWLAAVKELP